MYGYRHLIQILTVKHLQAQDIPLGKIRSLLEGADNRKLESLLPVGAPAALGAGDDPADRLMLAAARSASVCRPSAASAPSAASESPFDGEFPDLWHRIEISPGIELHVHAVALNGQDRETLRGALLQEIGRLRGWFGKD